MIVHTCDPSHTQEGGRYRKIRSSSSSSYLLQSQPELHEALSQKDEKKLCPHETCFPIMWLSLGRNEQTSAHICECTRAQMVQRQLCHWKPTLAWAGAQYCCIPEAPCLQTTQLADCPPSGLASFDCFQKGIFSIFFIINSQTVRQLWKSSHSAHRWHTTFLEVKHTTTSWQMNLSFTIHSYQTEPAKELPASCRTELDLSFLLRRLFHCIE